MASITVARHAAKRAKGEVAPWIVMMARLGFVAKALLYGTIGVLAAMAAFRGGGGSTDTRGAMFTLTNAPLGRVLAVAMALGLFGYALWRVIEGVLDPEQRGKDAKALAVRASFVIRGIAHGALGASALLIALRGRDNTGGGSGGGTEQGREATEKAFELPGGELLVWAAAIGIAGYGLYQLYRAAVAKLGKRLDVSHMSQEAGRWVIAVSRFGIAARGVVFIAIGWMVYLAARDHDASRAGGIREALTALRDLGRWVFAGVALGLIAYGVFQLLNARYRRIRVQ